MYAPKEAEPAPNQEMVTILAPSPFYNGLTAGVQFIMGTGQTSDPHLIQWFSQHGYSIVRNSRRSNHSKRHGRRRR